VLHLSGCPPDRSSLLFYGPTQIQAPFRDGFRCVGGGSTGIFRMPPTVPTDSSGDLSRAVDFNSPPMLSGPGGVRAGDTWNFQFWYRDPTGPGGTGSNLSDGLSVYFCL